ncbi:MAG: hypothetical protein ACYCSJ_07440 [Acidimicrobiales bacterium]
MLVVVVGAVGLGIGFLLPAILNAKPQRLPATTDLSPQPGAPFWTPILNQGEPPSDVLAGLVVPQGAKVTSYDNLDGGTSQYDRKATFFVAAPSSDVLGFYNLELPSLGWKLRGAAPTRDHKGTIILAYRFSRDSYEWQLQVGSEPTVNNGKPGSKLSIEAYQTSDAES